MQTFVQHLCESARDLVIDDLKFIHAFADVPAAQADIKAAKGISQRRAEKNSINIDQLRKEVESKWKPGHCPTCKGRGSVDGQKDCDKCDGTGLQGMNDSQAKWWLKTSSEVEALRKKTFKGHDDIAKMLDSKLVKDIVTAANRLGIHDAAKHLVAPHEDDGTEEWIYHAEYYQGHEQDYYIGALEGLLTRINVATAKKAGWVPWSFSSQA